MAVSKAKKRRMKQAQEGRRNPEESRYRNVGLYTRKTKDKTNYSRKGRKPSHDYYDDIPSFLGVTFSLDLDTRNRKTINQENNPLIDGLTPGCASDC